MINLYDYSVNYQLINKYIIFGVLNVIVFYCSYFLLTILQKVFFVMLKYYFLRNNPGILNSIKKKHLISRICWFIFLLVLIELDDLFCVPNLGFTKQYVVFIDHVAYFLMAPVCAITIASLLNVVQDHYKTSQQQNQQFYGYIPIFKFGAWLFCALIYVSIIFSQSIFSILTSLGAVSAIIALIFKDTIAGLIASFQNTSNQNVRVGDWVVLPNNQVEGIVEKITITSIKIRNFDNSFSVIPITMINQVAVKNKKYFEMSENTKKIVLNFSVDSASVCIIDPVKLEALKLEYRCPQIFEEGRTNLITWTDYINFYLSDTELLKSVYVFNPSKLSYTKIPQYLIALELSLYTESDAFDQIVAEVVNHIALSANLFGVKLINYASL